ncbi:MAG: NCS2 family permease [Coriobacteriales bacterium]|jgi:AGZA family xanthine/uracil permease-like MFS transporter
MEKFFKIRERGSSYGQEVVGGLTTFLAMAYIIAVNPQMLVAAGVPFNAALTATCLGAAVMTLAMGLFANRPLALASGMGINSIVAFTLCGGEFGVDWRVAMAVVLLEGIVILVLVLCGLRKAVMDAIPASLRHAIGIGIGLFIAFIGLKGGGIIVSNEDTYLGFGDVTSPTCIVALLSIVIAVILRARNVKGDLLISIVAATIIGIPLGVTPMPSNWNFGLDFSTFAAPFQTDPATNTMALVQVFAQPALLLMVFSLLMSDFFDTMGTVVAVGEQGEFADKDGNVEDIQKILVTDSAAAIVGGFVGASSITTFVESSSGAAAGARTGFSNVVIAIMFVICAFLSPIINMVSSAATCGALTVVGYLMLSDVVNIDWSRLETAFPAFFIIVGIPMTYSITNGIGLGFISYCLIMLAKGEGKKVSPLMWIATAAFVVMFLLL